MVEIGAQRQLMVDDFVIDKTLTTAREVIHAPRRRELMMTNDKPWEADGWVYYTVFEDRGLFRMYYLSMPMYNAEHTKHAPPFHHINYAESHDGIHWEKPSLGLFSFAGSRNNNIVAITDTMDAFHVFLDDNPRCPAEERYKAVYTKRGSRLWCMTSPDGIHFHEGWELSSEEKGFFDSHNTAFFDPLRGVYQCYYRGWHDNNGTRIRDIRRMESKDFRTWSPPEPIAYTDPTWDFHMYTNGIKPYFRAPQLYIGLPARYTDRPEWTANYDRLCGSAHRKWRMEFHPRFGLALTDGLLMTSRDGKLFHRRNEAFLRPGPESRKRWVYGDGYPGYGLLPTATGVRGEDDELSLYACVNCWSDEPVELYRYTLRMDGFASRRGSYGGDTLVTLPLTFTGQRLSINFSTSAAGSMTVTLLDEAGNPLPDYCSGPLFGDSTDRIVDFSAPLSALQGKAIRLRFDIVDGDLYSFQFQEA